LADDEKLEGVIKTNGKNHRFPFLLLVFKGHQ